MDEKIALYRKRCLRKFEIFVKKVTFVGFRGAIAPTPLDPTLTQTSCIERFGRDPRRFRRLFISDVDKYFWQIPQPGGGYPDSFPPEIFKIISSC